MIFGKKEKKVVEVDGKRIELEQRPGFLGSLKGKKQPKPVQEVAQQQSGGKTTAPITTQTTAQPIAQPAGTQPTTQQPSKQKFSPFSKHPTQPIAQNPAEVPISPGQQISKPAKVGKGSSKIKNYLEGIGEGKKGLELALRAQGVKVEMYEFVRNMLIASIALGIVISGTMIILFQYVGLDLIQSGVISVLLGVVVFYVSFQTFLNFPLQKGKAASKNIERDILFAARDMIISLRSGMPLFNAITSISTGYGDASTEFAKIVERVQLGTPLEDAIDQTVSETKSNSFRRIMLQAAVSIRAGADVVAALQSVIDQLSQERVIELRRYGQRLNAIAMFYMLFGIILPSMGIAVVTILTTFIAIFTVNLTVLEFAIVGIVFLQIVFLELITSVQAGIHHVIIWWR